MKIEATIRTADDEDLVALASNFRQMWLEIGWSPKSFRDDWTDVVTAFIARAKGESGFAAFVAETDAGIVGTVACQILAGLYPEIRLRSSYCAGYIWGVYIRPDFRRLGLATRLTRAALDRLATLGCTRVTLHASREGEPIYRKMGFRATNELSLEISSERMPAFLGPPS